MRRRIARALPKTVHPLPLLLAGETLVSAGLWTAWPPLAFIVLGVQIVVVALLRQHP